MAPVPARKRLRGSQSKSRGDSPDPFEGSTLTCTGTPYSDPNICSCMYHTLTRHFTPQPKDRPHPKHRHSLYQEDMF